MAIITEDYVSFETAKLLKEKGFDEVCYRIYDTKEKELFGTDGIEFKNHEADEETITAPTLQMAMKWLREVHNVNIEILYNRFVENYKYLIIYKPEVLDDIKSLGVFYYYEEAAEAAIEYCLKNLV